MTAVILAHSYDDADQAARLLGLGHDWVYPHRVELLRGVQVTRTVYVKGWRSRPGGGVSDDAYAMLAPLVTNATASDIVDLDRPGGVPVYMSAPAPMSMTGLAGERPPRPRRRLRLTRRDLLLFLTATAVSFGIGMVGNVGRWLGWW